MAEQLSLNLGRQDRDTGMALVTAHACADWAGQARAALTVLAWQGDPFTADDLIRIVGQPPLGSHPNVIGALIAGAARRGIITRTGDTQATRRTRHAGRIGVWVGVPFGGGDD